MNHKILFVFVMAATLLAAPLFGQSARLQMNLDHLAKEAIKSVVINMDPQLLDTARQLLGSGPDEAKVKSLVSGLEGIYVRSFEFDKEGAYSPAEVEALRKQLVAPAWSCLVAVRDKKSGANADVCLRQEAGKMLGLAIIADEPKKLTVVNILGSIPLDHLRDLEGQFGIPRMGLGKKGERPPKPKDPGKPMEE